MAELQKILLELWQNSKLPQSSIIRTANYKHAEKEIMKFISKVTLEHTKVSAENNIDIYKIELLDNKKGDSLKHLSVDQVRELQNKFSSTSVISPYKFGLIIQAELMNLNASNCLLKILEDTPQNAFIFLITNNFEKLIPTIRSRCIIIYQDKEAIIETNLDYKSSIYKILNPEVRFEDKLPDIEKFTNDKKIKIEEVATIINSAFLNILRQDKAPDDLELEELKEYIKRHNISHKKLFDFFDEAKFLLHSASESFLDLKQVILVLISKFLLLT